MQTLDQILELKPKVITVPVSDIKLNPKEKMLAEVKGYHTVLSDEARSNLVRISGLDENTIKTIRETSGTAASDLILGKAFESLKSKKVTLALDGARISRIVLPEKKHTAMSQYSVVAAVEMLVKKGMKIWGVQTSPDGTGAKIQILNPQVREHPNKKNESVTIGRTINWDALGGTSIQNFVQRMVCSNGATLNEDGRVIRVLEANSSPADVYKALFEYGVDNSLRKYFEGLDRMSDIRMSVREWNQLLPWLQMFEKDREVINEHIGYDFGKHRNDRWDGEYFKRSIDIDRISMDKQKVCQTPINWWDMTNCLTYLASHETTSDVTDWHKGELMQVVGKQINRRSFDAHMWMSDLPEFGDN